MATLQDDNAFISDAILGPRRLVVNTGEYTLALRGAAPGDKLRGVEEIT
jgi:hypothetical protein